MWAGEKRRERRKQATSVMGFIPSVQSITQVVNRGPDIKGRMLSPVNALGQLYWGQAVGRVSTARDRQTVCALRGSGGSLFSSHWLRRSLCWLAIIWESLHLILFFPADLLIVHLSPVVMDIGLGSVCVFEDLFVSSSFKISAAI